MDYDISQPIPQGSNGAQDAENSRIAAIADELERLCAVHEAQSGNCQQDVSRFETEQRVAEQMAKSQGFWVPMIHVFDLGVPGPSGNENDTYVGEKVIYKVNNLLRRLLKKVALEMVNTRYGMLYLVTSLLIMKEISLWLMQRSRILDSTIHSIRILLLLLVFLGQR